MYNIRPFDYIIVYIVGISASASYSNIVFSKKLSFHITQKFFTTFRHIFNILEVFLFYIQPMHIAIKYYKNLAIIFIIFFFSHIYYFFQSLKITVKSSYYIYDRIFDSSEIFKRFRLYRIIQRTYSAFRFHNLSFCFFISPGII